MPAINKTYNNIRYGGGATISSNVKSHANDPFVVKKTEAAKIAVGKLVLPATKKN